MAYVRGITDDVSNVWIAIEHWIQQCIVMDPIERYTVEVHLHFCVDFSKEYFYFLLFVYNTLQLIMFLCNLMLIYFLINVILYFNSRLLTQEIVCIIHWPGDYLDYFASSIDR